MGLLYDGLDIVQERQSGSVSANHIRTMNIDEPLARIKSDGTVRYYQQDALGSVIALTDTTGAIKTRYSYDPFGKVTITGEVSDNPFQYSGRENDGTGLYYYRARYYSPELQRFISEDPIRLRGGINFYAYVGNNPVNWIDPEGFMGSSPPRDKKKGKKEYKNGDLCIEKLKQRKNNGSCPTEDDCTLCCAELSGTAEYGVFAICESLCLSWIKSIK